MSFYHPRRERDQIARAALGYFAETVDRSATQGGTAHAASGTAHFMAVGLRAGDVVTNIHMHCTGAGASLTLVKFGLYDKAGTKLAVTADIKASVAVAMVSAAVTAAYTVPTDDVYFLGVLATAGTTPSWNRSGTLLHKPVSGKPQLNYDVAGLTDLDAASLSFSADTGTRTYWVGVS